MRILESKRLLLKPVTEEDLSFLLDLRWNAGVMKYLVHDPIGMKEQAEWFRTLNTKKNLALSVFLKEGKETKICGTVGLYDIDTRHMRATWRIRLSPEVQGKGIGFEATAMTMKYGFDTLNLNRIVSNSMADNAAIIKMTQKLGFTDEGVLRKHYFFNGKYNDAIQFGILREEFYGMGYVKEL